MNAKTAASSTEALADELPSVSTSTPGLPGAGQTLAEADVASLLEGRTAYLAPAPIPPSADVSGGLGTLIQEKRKRTEEALRAQAEVPIFIPRTGRGIIPGPVWVQINGVRMLVPRGVQTTVPEQVYELLAPGPGQPKAEIWGESEAE